MNDFLPCALPHSQVLHACDLFGAPALCRPDGPEPMWVSRWGWDAWTDVLPLCPSCAQLMRARSELDDVERQVAGW